MTISMTQRQYDCLDFIKNYIETHDGVGPCFEEIMVGLGLSSKSRVHALVTALEERGHIRRRYHGQRSIEIIDQRPLAIASLIQGATPDDLIQMRQIIDAQIEALAA